MSMNEEPTQLLRPPVPFAGGEDDPVPDSPPPGSVLDAVLQKRQEQLGDRLLDLEVPGYGGQLLLRMQPLPPGALRRITAKADRLHAGERELAVNADMLVAGCREVMGRRTADADPEPLLPEETLRIDEALADTLQMKGRSARALLLELFEKANDPQIAVNVAAAEYAQWCSQANDEVSTNLLGESPATRE